MRSASSGRLASLDGIRAVSIALVLAEHGWKTLPATLQASPVAPIIGNGGLGVFIFFVISGFLITHLLMEERVSSGTISIKNFYIRRSFRIWPAFYIFIATIGALGAFGAISLHLSELLHSALYVWNYTLGNNTWFLGHTWSLAVEEQFYLIWPLAFKLMDLKSSAIAAAVLIVVTPILRVGTYLLAPEWKGHIGMMLHTRADALMFGALTAMVYAEPKFRALLQSLFRKRLHLLAFLFLFILSPLLAARFGGAYSLSIGWTLEGCCIVLLLVWVMQNPSSLVGKVLNWKPLVHIGVLSYSLYLWQQLFLTDSNHTASGAFPINLLCTLLVAELSYHLVERPFLRLRYRFFHKPDSAYVLPESQLTAGR